MRPVGLTPNPSFLIPCTRTKGPDNPGRDNLATYGFAGQRVHRLRVRPQRRVHECLHRRIGVDEASFSSPLRAHWDFGPRRTDATGIDNSSTGRRRGRPLSVQTASPTVCWPRRWESFDKKGFAKQLVMRDLELIVKLRHFPAHREVGVQGRHQESEEGHRLLRRIDGRGRQVGRPRSGDGLRSTRLRPRAAPALVRVQ